MSSSKAIMQEVELRLDNYLHNFNSGHFDEVANYFYAPFMSIALESVSVLHDRTDIKNSLITTVERLKKDGFHHSEWSAPKKIVVLDGAGLVLASCRFRRLRQDGTLCEQFTATYTLRKANDQEWLIVAVHLHPFATPLN
ncbi:hypothetical protein B0A52_07465 [Exophiala mesophila]|uniref:DUF6841 domain-containing protein n=1 Tax=Exophiala mesophila TaxID=212818 RepID=A0A438MXK2_EXOME|nr:hypothetical protein B0A52_07465 [Exophiala mesophila]